jgi:hypothetical protein
MDLDVRIGLGMHSVEKECVEKYRLVTTEGEIFFTLGTDTIGTSFRFGRLTLDLKKKRIFFHPDKKGMESRVVMFYLNYADYVPETNRELIELYRSLKVILKKPRWVIMQRGLFYCSYSEDFKNYQNYEQNHRHLT